MGKALKGKIWFSGLAWLLLPGFFFTPVSSAAQHTEMAVPGAAVMEVGGDHASKPAEKAAKGGGHPQFPHFFAPLGVFGAHVIKPGKFLIAYTYGHMVMNGNLIKTASVSTAELLQRYNVVPVKMEVDMHMVGLMRGMTEKFTLMAMVPYSVKSMTMVMRKNMRTPVAGTVFETHADGIGDVQLGGTFLLYRTAGHEVVFYGGVSIPTGSIDVRDNTPRQQNAKLGYTMQLGTGTLDLVPALTYSGKWGRLLWGGQASGVVRFYDNSNHYHWGSRYRVTSWLGCRIFADPYYSCITSLRLDWQSWGNIHGADPELNPTTTPGADPGLRGGSRLDILPGFNLYIDKGKLKGNRLFVEGGVPLYQYLDGPQGRTTWLILAGWKFIF